MTDDQLAIIQIVCTLPIVLLVLVVLWRFRPSKAVALMNPVVRPVAKKDVPVPEPVLDTAVAAIIRSMQTEPLRWDLKMGSAYRDDGVSFDCFGEKVWVYDDFREIGKKGGENCRVTIEGQHNSAALKDAQRLFVLRKNIKDTPVIHDTMQSLRGKLGI